MNVKLISCEWVMASEGVLSGDQEKPGNKFLWGQNHDGKYVKKRIGRTDREED